MAQQSLRDLIRLASSQDANDRNLLAESLSELVLASGRSLSEAEQDLVFDIVRQIIHDVEMRVRRLLADKLAARDNTPHDLVMTLANDVIEVAYPILTKSKVLQDGDLISLILEHTARHQLAITQRETISPQVSDQLVDTGDPEVIRSLLDNSGAKISEKTFEELVDQSQTMVDLQGSLARRADLPNALADRMYHWVGDAIREYLVERLGGNDVEMVDIESQASEDLKEAIEEALTTEPITPEAPDIEDREGYLPHPRVLVRALENGDIFRFEELFRAYTDLSESGVTRLLYDAGPEALAIACKASGIDRYSFSDILCNLHGAGDALRYRETPPYLKTMDYFERIQTAGAKQVLGAWRKTDGI